MLFVANTVTVWIVGSSLIRDAFVRARAKTEGINLGLSRIGTKIWWQGYSGLVVKNVEAKIESMLKYETPPNYIVLHVGGNDLGKVKVGVLRNNLKCLFSKLSSRMPSTKFIWSQILPRSEWRFSNNKTAMEAARKRINSSIGAFVIGKGGHYIRYPDIALNDNFFKVDGVHLTTLGNDIMLNTLQGAIESFITTKNTTFPVM